MSHRPVDESVDAVHDTLRLLAPTLTARIIHQLQNGPARMQDLQDEVEDCNPSTLANCLPRMRSAALIEYSGQRRLWRLTPFGRAAIPLLRAVDQWARQRNTDNQGLSALLRVEQGLKTLSKSHTTHVITALGRGPLHVKQLRAVLPAPVSEHNLRARLHILTRDQIVAQDRSAGTIRYQLTPDGLEAVKVHHRAAGLSAWRRQAAKPACGQGRSVPPLVFSHPAQRRAG